MVKFEQQQIQFYYEMGVISLEERNKLIEDITPELWEELYGYQTSIGFTSMQQR